MVFQVEQKLLETAESLLVADHQKSEKRTKDISTHKSNIQHLETALADAKGQCSLIFIFPYNCACRE